MRSYSAYRHGIEYDSPEELEDNSAVGPEESEDSFQRYEHWLTGRLVRGEGMA